MAASFRERPTMPTQEDMLSGKITVLAKPATATKVEVPEHTVVETYKNATPEKRVYFDVEAEEIHMILSRIGDDIYSTVDACTTAKKMLIAIEWLHQDGESIESYYSRFYKIMNEIVRKQLEVATMQVNVKFLQQLQPEWSRYVTIVKQQEKLDTISYHKVYDILKQYQNKANEIHAEEITRNANPLALECGKPKRVKDYAYYKKKMMLCKQEKKGVPLSADQGDWLDDTNEEPNEQELEAHYMYMEKIQKVLTVESRPSFDVEPLEQVHIKDDYNMFANERQHSEQPESINDTYMVEKVDSNVILDSSDMCDNEGKANQDAEENEYECVMIANLIANLKLDTNENKKIQKQLKKANTSLTHELKECKYALEESNEIRDRCRKITVLAKPATATKVEVPEHTVVETYKNATPEKRVYFDVEAEEIHMILSRIGDDIYSTVDACTTAKKMLIAIEWLHQDGESIESYYSRFYKIMNEIVRNQLEVATMQVNVKFLQQLQPEWSRYVTIVKQQEKLDTISYHKVYDILKQYQNKANEIHAEEITRNANPLALECGKPKRVKDYAYYKKKMMLCKQEKKGVPLSADQGDWLDDTNEEPNEQELEAHYMYMEKIQKVLTVESRPSFDVEPLEQVHIKDDYNMFANERQHSEQPESINDTYMVEKVDSNVILDSSDMCDNEGKANQDAEENEYECVMIANLIANLKLDTNENKKIQKQLKKANTSLTHELKECKYALEESNEIRDRCRSALHDQGIELKKSKKYKNCQLRKEEVECKCKDTIGLLTQQKFQSNEALKIKAFETFQFKEKNDELAHLSSLEHTRYDLLRKENKQLKKDFEIRQDKDIEKLIALKHQGSLSLVPLTCVIFELSLRSSSIVDLLVILAVEYCLLSAVTELVDLIEPHDHLNSIFVLKCDSSWRVDYRVVILVFKARGIPSKFDEVELSLVAFNPELEVFYSLFDNQVSGP
nr:hypothetical protein [Tanacetum cinerariifolium]